MAFILCEDEDLVDAAKFYADMLNISDQAIIGITVVNELYAAGYCVKRDHNDIPYYIIKLGEPEGEHAEPLEAILAHEMVHVMQYETGRLADHGSYCIWEGNKYSEHEVGSKNYYFSPWEVEAFGMQVGLVELYFRGKEQ